MADLNEIINRIEPLSKSKEGAIVAIDGRCGAGKTTLSEKLSEIFDCTVFHMDDFFLRKEQRTAKRLSTPGEFVDHERFLEEILLPAKEKGQVVLRKFDYKTFEPGEGVEVNVKPLIIVEGSYSCNENLKPFYDLKIFVTTDSETQLERIKKRNPEKINMFVEKWIPLEELYFTNLEVENFCDLIYRT